MDSMPTHNYFVETGILKIYSVDNEKMEEIVHGFVSVGKAVMPYRGANEV